MRLFTFICFIMLVSCAERSKHIPQSTSDKNDFMFDTTFNTNTIDTHTHTKIKKWADLTPFFGVYRFSDKILGIGIEIENGGNYELTDSLVRVHQSAAAVIVDSNQQFILKRAVKLNKSILQNDTTRIFNTYCTKGITQSKVIDILYSDNECSNVLIFVLSPIDTSKYGEPLIASKQYFNMIYSNHDLFQQKLLNYHQYLLKQADYIDNITPKLFAYNEQYFFVYDDNFQWHKQKDKDCLFPARRVFQKKGKIVSLKWGSGLDLLGIPCD